MSPAFLRWIWKIAFWAFEALGLLQIARWIHKLLGYGEHIEFVAHYAPYLGRLGFIIDALLNPPPALGLAIVVGGLILIWWSLMGRTPEGMAIRTRKLTTWGPWILIMGGPLLGLIWLYIGSGSKTRAPHPPASPPVAAPTPAPSLPPSVPREFANRTPRQLLALYGGRTPFQADKLIEPFKGLWIRAESRVLNILPDGPGRSIVVLRDDKDTIECRFGPQWANAIGRLDVGETLEVIGKLSDNQNGSQLYLLECEIAAKEKQGSIDPARAIELALIENPESVKASPLYIKLSFRFNPETGALSPLDRVERGKEELQKLFEQARKGSFEAYLIAGHLSEWLKKNARACYASSKNFFDVVDFIERRMDDLHERYHGISSVADGRTTLARAAREVFTATHKTKAAEVAGIEGMSVDGIVEWYCNFLIHVCQVKLWAIHPASNSREESLDMPHNQLVLNVQDHVATLEDKQTRIVYTEPRIQEKDITRAIDLLKAFQS